MHEQQMRGGYRAYWITWAILLALTGIMLATETTSFARIVIGALLMTAMIVKAALIAGEFMHLRSEKPWLIVSVAGSILFLAAFLFIVISFDGRRILAMVKP